MSNLTSIPRVPSGASNKNTIEWEIQNKVSVGLMLVQRIGYTFIVKIKKDKKHWWSSAYKTLVVSGQNVMELIQKISDFLEQYGYYIDADTIELGEVVGFTNQCSSCGSKNIKISETKDDFLKWKPEGEKVVRQKDITKTKYFCWDCEHTWEVRN